MFIFWAGRVRARKRPLDVGYELAGTNRNNHNPRF